MSALYVEYPLEYIYDTWLKCGPERYDGSRTRMASLAFLLLELPPFVLLLKSIPCLLCNSNTLRNILMVLCRNVNRTRGFGLYKNDNSAFLLPALSPIVMLTVILL